MGRRHVENSPLNDNCISFKLRIASLVYFRDKTPGTLENGGSSVEYAHTSKLSPGNSPISFSVPGMFFSNTAKCVAQLLLTKWLVYLLLPFSTQQEASACIHNVTPTRGLFISLSSGGFFRLPREKSHRINVRCLSVAFRYALNLGTGLPYLSAYLCLRARAEERNYAQA